MAWPTGSGRRVPLACFASGEGPTVVVFGGNHGDEYVGQLAASWLARSLDLADVQGRIIVVPCLSGEASRSGTRLWPTGENFNRIFPGDDQGSAAAKLAHFVTTELFPRSDAVIDIHSGGHSMYSLPVSHMHWEEDLELRRRMLHHMLAWNTGHHFIYGGIGGAGERLLPGQAALQGKTVVTTELGGGSYVDTATLKIANDGLRNVLRSLRVLRGEVISEDQSVILDSRDPACYVETDRPGLFENMVVPGEHVRAGQVVGRVHDMLDLAVPPAPCYTPFDATVVMVRAFPVVTPGSVAVVLGVPITSEEILRPD